MTDQASGVTIRAIDRSDAVEPDEGRIVYHLSHLIRKWTTLEICSCIDRGDIIYVAIKGCTDKRVVQMCARWWVGRCTSGGKCWSAGRVRSCRCERWSSRGIGARWGRS